jgi:hypothetical protein
VRCGGDRGVELVRHGAAEAKEPQFFQHGPSRRRRARRCTSPPTRAWARAELRQDLTLPRDKIPEVNYLWLAPSAGPLTGGSIWFSSLMPDKVCAHEAVQRDVQRRPNSAASAVTRLCESFPSNRAAPPWGRPGRDGPPPGRRHCSDSSPPAGTRARGASPCSEPSLPGRRWCPGSQGRAGGHPRSSSRSRGAAGSGRPCRRNSPPSARAVPAVCGRSAWLLLAISRWEGSAVAASVKLRLRVWVPACTLPA